jgi:sigma-B regulation protein RsbU (phosphoserine phosphatase)
LEKRLVEVEELSQRAVQQERRAVHEETERRILEAEHERRTEELEAARRLQLAMLPQTAPEVPGVDLAFRMVTATEVGGDYVDFRIGDGGRILVAVGDATSHGLQAGMVVAVAKSLFHGTSLAATPGDVLSHVGAGLQSLRERYASMAMAVVAIEDGRLEVASAGMPPVLIRRGGSGEVEEILLPGVPLGTLADEDYPVREVPIGSGDVVLMMSDGLIEEVDASGDAFGYGRVASHVASCDVSSAEATVNGLFESATAFVGSSQPHDDVTILAMIIE